MFVARPPATNTNTRTHSPTRTGCGYNARTLECPKCHFDHPQQTQECLKCGVVFAKYLAFQESVAAVRAVEIEPAPEVDAAAAQRAHNELLCRIFAVPAALLLGWLVNQGMPTLTAFLSMWVHECGHAITAWLCGYTAFPTAWITIIPEERGRWISVVLAALLVAGGYVAYRFQRWFWLAASAAVLALVIAGNLQTDFRSRMLITFWGDGGAFALSTILMMTFYAGPNSPLTKNQVRWGLLLLGALAFWSVYSRWGGGFEKIANFLEDTDERGPSDARLLITMYGWPIGVMQARYMLLAHACLGALAAAYAAGLAQAKRMSQGLKRLDESRENSRA